MQDRPATLSKKILWHTFFCEFCEIFKNTFFIEQLRWLLLSIEINEINVNIVTNWVNFDSLKAIIYCNSFDDDDHNDDIIIIIMIIIIIITIAMIIITHFWPMFPFHTPWEYQKTFGFLMFSGGIRWYRLIIQMHFDYVFR